MNVLHFGQATYNLDDAADRYVVSDCMEELGRIDEMKLLRGRGPVKAVDGVVKPNWCKSTILQLLRSNVKAVYRGLIVLFERQTMDEKQNETTKHLNLRGFNAVDAKFGSDLAKRCMKPDPRYPHPLSSKQVEAARKLLRKYAGQLAKVANGEK